MIKHLKVPAHLLAFIFSIWAYWAFTFERSNGSAATSGILLYVMLANLKRREILPSIGILTCFCFFNFISHGLVYHFIGWDFAAAPYVLTLEIFIYVFFGYALYKYHCRDELFVLVKSDIRRVFIPQSVGISIIMLLSVFPFLVALGEVAVHHYDNTVFSGPPFFYRNYELFKSISHTLIMLGVWSMMLDAHYLKERLQKKISA